MRLLTWKLCSILRNGLFQKYPISNKAATPVHKQTRHSSQESKCQTGVTLIPKAFSMCHIVMADKEILITTTTTTAATTDFMVQAWVNYSAYIQNWSCHFF